MGKYLRYTIWRSLVVRGDLMVLASDERHGILVGSIKDGKLEREMWLLRGLLLVSRSMIKMGRI